ncbi:hypothetical protein EV215_0089 [Hypnocyclicus thermotrophus]|uniref:Uncharacterized protein n=1 Tax=Hypnocyclicus thermotrophus TaxID=1627895 RepID=A0AA46E045_9FUSO|nr:hypothetical protein [Hypnocyclicus thermotrophus]TDT72301.1 hypothetical protein EV215_0089 [Hypnocyclicus thermotrophus]
MKKNINDISIRQVVNFNISEILIENGYNYESINDSVALVTLKDIDTKTIIVKQDNILFIQQEIINLNQLKEDLTLYKKLLDLNTEILPVSIAIDSTDEKNQKLVINESLNITNLDVNEVLQVFEAIELALPKIFNIIKEYK